MQQQLKGRFAGFDEAYSRSSSCYGLGVDITIGDPSDASIESRFDSRLLTHAAPKPLNGALT